METLRHEQIQEFREHQPIPYGWVKLLAGTIVTLVLLENYMWFGLSIAKQLTGKVPGGLNAGIGALFMVVTMFVIGTYVVTGARREWLSAYWHRNVRGYVPLFWLTDVQGEDGKTCTRLAYAISTAADDARNRRLRSVPRDARRSMAINLPLGGWTTLPTWIACTDDGMRTTLTGWSVRLRAIFETGTVLVELRKRNHYWSMDERIVTDIRDALRYLEEVATHRNIGHSVLEHFRWKTNQLDVAERDREELRRRPSPYFDPPGQVPTDRSFVEFAEEQMRRRVAERDAARGEVDRYEKGFLPAAVADRDKARGERDEALRETKQFVYGVAAEIEKMHRLGDTIEGLRLLDRCVNWLCWTAVQDSPEYRGLQEWLARVRGKLAEKQKADRKRHGRKADAATGA